MRKIAKKLQNPFLLVGEGFLIGGLFLLAAQGDANARPAAHPAHASVLRAL